MKTRNLVIVSFVGLPLVLFALQHFLSADSATIPSVSPRVNRQSSPAVTPGAAPPVESAPLLEIGEDEWSWKRSDDSVVVTGQVRSISDRPLRDVVAEVSFFDGDGRFIASAEALVFPSPIQAGQAVNFEVRRAWDPEIREARVGFQDVVGAPLETRWKQLP